MSAFSVHASSARQSASSSKPAPALLVHCALARTVTFCERMMALLTRGESSAVAAVGDAAARGNGGRAETSLPGRAFPLFASRCCCTGDGEVGIGDARGDNGDNGDGGSGESGKDDSGGGDSTFCETSTANSSTSSESSRSLACRSAKSLSEHIPGARALCRGARRRADLQLAVVRRDTELFALV